MLDVLCLLEVVGNLGVFAAGGAFVEVPGGWKVGGCNESLLGARFVRGILAGWNKPDQVSGGWIGTYWAMFAAG